MFGTRWDVSKPGPRPPVEQMATAQMLAQHYGRRTLAIIGVPEHQPMVWRLATLAAHNARLYLDGMENP